MNSNCVSKRGMKNAVFFSLSLLIIITIIIVLSLLAFVYIHRKREVKGVTISHKKYQYFQLNLHTNESSSSIVSLQRTDLGGDYLSYKNDEDEYILLSKFGLNEFKCTGSCFCSDTENSLRRSVSSPIFRGLIHLVAATTSLLAIRYAKEYFENQCREEMIEQSDCPESFIHSEVDNCEEVVYPPYIKEEFENYGSKFERKSYKSKTTIYICEGSCLPNKYNRKNSIYDPELLDDPSYEGADVVNEYSVGYDEVEPLHNIALSTFRLKEVKRLNFKCEELFLQKEIWIDPNLDINWIDFDEFTHENWFGAKEKDRYTKEFYSTMARWVFTYNHLQPFCFRNSMHKFKRYNCDKYYDSLDCEHLDYYEFLGGKGDDNPFPNEKYCMDCENLDDEWGTRHIPICVGHNKLKFPRINNPSIVCREMREKTLLYREQLKKK